MRGSRRQSGISISHPKWAESDSPHAGQNTASPISTIIDRKVGQFPEVAAVDIPPGKDSSSSISREAISGVLDTTRVTALPRFELRREFLGLKLF